MRSQYAILTQKLGLGELHISFFLIVVCVSLNFVICFLSVILLFINLCNLHLNTLHQLLQSDACSLAIKRAHKRESQMLSKRCVDNAPLTFSLSTLQEISFANFTSFLLILWKLVPVNVLFVSIYFHKNSLNFCSLWLAMEIPPYNLMQKIWQQVKGVLVKFDKFISCEILEVGFFAKINFLEN